MASGSFAVVDWRRRTAALYAQIRAEPDPREAHAIWCATRAEMLKPHPASPVPASERAAYPGPPVAPYDAGLRFEVEIDTDVEPRRLEIPTGTDGIVPFERAGRLDLPGVGSLDVWWLASYGGGLFVPVKDALAGTETYGGGRYLIHTAQGADPGGGGHPPLVGLHLPPHPPPPPYPSSSPPPPPPPPALAPPPRAAGALDPAPRA